MKVVLLILLSFIFELAYSQVKKKPEYYLGLEITRSLYYYTAFKDGGLIQLNSKIGINNWSIPFQIGGSSSTKVRYLNKRIPKGINVEQSSFFFKAGVEKKFKIDAGNIFIGVVSGPSFVNEQWYSTINNENREKNSYMNIVNTIYLGTSVSIMPKKTNNRLFLEYKLGLSLRANLKNSNLNYYVPGFGYPLKKVIDEKGVFTLYYHAFSLFYKL